MLLLLFLLLFCLCFRLFFLLGLFSRFWRLFVLLGGRGGGRFFRTLLFATLFEVVFAVFLSFSAMIEIFKMVHRQLEYSEELNRN